MSILSFITGFIVGFLVHSIISSYLLNKVREKYDGNYINERLLRKEGLGHLIDDEEFDIFKWLKLQFRNIYRSVSKFTDKLFTK